MDVHKAAAWAQIIYLPAGLYCAYGTFATLHPGFQMPGVNPTVFDISLGALLVCALLVVVDKMSGLFPHKSTSPKVKDASEQPYNFWKFESSRWQKKWENERGGSSARDETIKQLTQERDAARLDRDTAYCAEVDRHNATKIILAESEARVRQVKQEMDRPEIVPISFGREGFPIERGGPYGILLSNDGHSVALDACVAPFGLGRWQVTFTPVNRIEPGEQIGIEIFMDKGDEGGCDLVHVLRDLQSATGTIGEPVEFSINFRDLKGKYSSLCEMRLDSHAVRGLRLTCKEVVPIA